MKPIIRILLIVLLLVLYSCKSIALYDTSTDYDFKFDLYSQVKMYFRANLKYPTVNELWDYCWKITNEVNDNTFLSFDDFDKAAYKNVSGREELLQHLSLYKKEISFQFKKGAMFVLWKNKKWFKIEFDLGEMIADNGYKFVYFYDMQGNYSLDFDYEEDFQKIRKEVRDKCVPDTTLWSEFHTCLLRFDRIKGYQLYYLSKNKIKENIYLKELGCALDNFLLNRNLQMIQFVTNLPQSYLYK